MANKFTQAVKKAKTLYKSGRFKTFGDAVKKAYKSLGSTSTTVAKAKPKTKFRQTGTSNAVADKKRIAKRPGKRKSATGKTYYERRKNRSDVPFAMARVGTNGVQHSALHQIKQQLGYIADYEKSKRHNQVLAKNALSAGDKYYYKRKVQQYSDLIATCKQTIQSLKKSIR